ncbi:MAG: ABC transporter ATP-binding protein [Pseudomonadota bacterium]
MKPNFGYIGEEFPDTSYDLALLVRLAKYLKPYLRHLFFSVLLILIITGVELVLPYLTKIAIDDYILTTARKILLPPGEPMATTVQTKYQKFLIPTQEPNVFFVREKDSERIDQKLLLQLKKRGWFEKARYYPAPLHREAVKTLINRQPHLIYRSEACAFIPYDHLKAFPIDQLISLRQQDLSGVIWIGVIFIFLLFLEFVCSYSQIYSMEYTGQKIMHDLRIHLCGHLQKLSLHFFDSNPVGKLVTRTTNDIQNLQDMFSSIIVQFLKDFILLLGIMTVMLFLNWRLALVCFILLPIIVVITILVSVKARDAFREVRKLIARINSYIQENFSGILVVKIFNRQIENARRFQQINYDHYLANIRQIIVFAIFMPAIELFSAVAIALVIWKGGSQVISQTISLGVLVAFLSYIQRMFQPIRFLAEKYNIMQSALASAERVFSLLDENDIITDPLAPEIIAPVKGKVEFQNVVFAYDEGEPVLKNVSFTIKEGETVAVVGPTGAGKTTLIKLLVRFYDAQGGKILLDGVDIRSLEQHFLRSHVGVVMQDSFLFADTIGYNICLGNPHITNKDLEDVARLVNADRFINKLSKGFDEVLSEEGSTLSTGERQLICFARVLAFNPKILVLDEATSNIDPGTERLVQEALVKLTSQRTSLIIAHRLSTIQRADRILVLHKGEIKEEGTHEELMTKKGIYYRLYQLQYQ